METGKIIKSLRLTKGMTQEELGQALGVKKSAIQKYESGMVENLKRSTIAKMAEIFDVTPAYIMGWGKERDTYNAKLSESELTHIEKYRQLDERGRTAVDDTLNREFSYIGDGKTTIRIAARGGGISEKRVDKKLIEELKKLAEENKNNIPDL